MIGGFGGSSHGFFFEVLWKFALISGPVALLLLVLMLLLLPVVTARQGATKWAKRFGVYLALMGVLYGVGTFSSYRAIHAGHQALERAAEVSDLNVVDVDKVGFIRMSAERPRPRSCVYETRVSGAFEGTITNEDFEALAQSFEQDGYLVLREVSNGASLSVEVANDLGIIRISYTHDEIFVGVGGCLSKLESSIKLCSRRRDIDPQCIDSFAGS